MMYERAILHLDLDAFFVSVECLKNRALRGKPLIIGGTSNRGVVSSCSYEARKFGIQSAMPMKLARQLCPDAIILKGDMETYSKHSGIVTEIIQQQAPLFEKASIDEFYLDLTGMDKFIGCYKWSKELRQTVIKESGLPISFGLSINKLVSKVGTGESKPNGAIEIKAGTEKQFLAPLSTSKIPSIGKSTYKKLSFMGVRTIQTLSELPIKLLEREFGKPGISLWKKANGIDHSPVVPYSERKSMSTERTFSKDTIDIRRIKGILIEMTCQMAYELRQSEKLTSCITVKIRYTDFNTYTKQRKIVHTANDHTLTPHILELFDQLYQRRQLIRLVGIRFTGLVRGSYQINLFDDTIKEIHLLQQMDRIRKRFGKKALKMGSAF